MVGLGVVLVGARAASLPTPPCPFRALTGIPCPGCGITRLADAVAHGHLTTALRADVAGVAVLVALATIAAVHVAHRSRADALPPRWLQSRALPVVLGALIAVHWVTTIVTGGLPSR